MVVFTHSAMRDWFFVVVGALVLNLAIDPLRKLLTGKPLVGKMPLAVQFGERGCSARWTPNWTDWLWRPRRINHFMIVYVADDRMVATSRSPTRFYAWGNPPCEIDVPVSRIARVTTVRWLSDDVLRIEMIDQTCRPFEVLVHDEAALLNALGPRIADATQVTADRPLFTGYGELHVSRRLILLITAFVGAVVMVGCASSLLADHAVRSHGVATIGTFAGYDGLRGTVRYQVDNEPYTVASEYGCGLWRPGQTETVIYDPANPSRSVEGKSSPGWIGLIALGCVMLIIGLFGSGRFPAKDPAD